MNEPYIPGKRPSPLYIPRRRSLQLPPPGHPPFPRLWVVLLIWVPAGWVTIMGLAWVITAILTR